MAASTGVFVTTPTAGVNLYDASSTPKFAPLLRLAGSDGFARIYGKAIKAQGSIATVGVGTAGSLTTLGSTTATWIMNFPGGVTAGQYVYVKARTI